MKDEALRIVVTDLIDLLAQRREVTRLEQKKLTETLVMLDEQHEQKQQQN